MFPLFSAQWPDMELAGRGGKVIPVLQVPVSESEGSSTFLRC